MSDSEREFTQDQHSIVSFRFEETRGCLEAGKVKKMDSFLSPPKWNPAVDTDFSQFRTTKFSLDSEFNLRRGRQSVCAVTCVC